MSMATETLSGIFRTLAAILLSLVLYLGAWGAVDVRWYFDLRGVLIDPAREYSRAPIVVSRDIGRDFDGGYSVTIREQPSNHVFCATGDVQVPYRASTSPLDDRDLEWWATGGDCTAKLLGGLPAGIYSVETCHYVSRPFVILPRKTHCIAPTIFQIYAEGNAPAPIQGRLN